MIANYHTHTHYCGHASGEMREYIDRAVSNGIKILGFSDHAPFGFPDGRESGFRVKTADAGSYIAQLRDLREEYRGKIEIHIGFEMEYYPLFFRDMLSYVNSLGAEYLILGEHFTHSERTPEAHFCSRPTDSPEQLETYVNEVSEGIATGAFSYLAHPDVINFTGDRVFYRNQMRRLCRSASALKVPVEINFLGIRDHRHYPNEDFWRIAGEEGCTAVYGFDAHNPESAFDGGSIAAADELRDRYSIPLLETITLNDPAKILAGLNKI